MASSGPRVPPTEIRVTEITTDFVRVAWGKRGRRLTLPGEAPEPEAESDEPAVQGCAEGGKECPGGDVCCGQAGTPSNKAHPPPVFLNSERHRV